MALTQPKRHANTMSQAQPVESEIGVLRGRDCIYLDSVELREGTNVLVLRGEINGDLCSRQRPGELIPYRLTFRGVLAIRLVELDSWCFDCASSFDECVSSPWIRELGGKVTQAHRHFVVQTYDDVFDVVCETFELELPPTAA